MSAVGASQATYVEMAAPSLGQGVREWVQKVPVSGSPVEQLHLPHGGVEVRWHRHQQPIIVGPSTHPTIEVIEPGDEVVGIRVAPGRWPAPAHGSMTELVGRIYPLEATIGRACDTDTHDNAEVRATALRRALDPFLRSGPTGAFSTLVDAAHRRDQPTVQISTTANWSERHTRRQVRHATGLAIRDLRRIGRFQRFVALVQDDVARRERRSPVELAVSAGYADQSHLQRACRRLAGLTLAGYLDRTHDHCAGHHHPPSGHPA